jgi:adenosylmethionine-8-amino-7-oxononanoate aminotransferase
VLFVADEVITGFGRCGDWFASSRFDLEPDLITGAKGITSGYLPMGVVIAAPWVAEPFWAPGAGVWRHGYTYSGHATAAAAALANLDILEREDLCGRALALEGPLLDALRPLAEHELVEEVRGGLGLLAAVNLRRELVEADAGLPGRVGMACREAGLLIRPLVGGALAVSPPLVITRDEIDELASRFHAGLDACA